MPVPAIEFQDVSKVFQRRLGGQETRALSAVSFDVAPGEVCAFLGPNGAGKTTSISILMGFLPASSGTVRVLGFEPGDVRAKRQIGFLPENFAFYKHLNAEQLLRFHLELAGIGAQGNRLPDGRGSVDTSELISRLIAQVKLYGYENLKIGKYSRGMVQRLGIAQALLADPQLLILDEPTSGLDPAGRKEVRDLILSLKNEGRTIFLSSHNLSEVEQICNRVIIIDHGKLVRSGTLEELLGHGDRVQVVTDQLPESLEQSLLEQGAKVEREPHGVHIEVPSTQKRELVETLWAAGCDVISINPVRSTLESLFLTVVQEAERVQ